MVDIYNSNQRYEAVKKTIDSWKTTEYNKELIKRFLKSEIERLSPAKKISTLNVLKALFNGTTKREKVISKSLNKIENGDFRDIDSKLWNLNLKPQTHKFYNNTIKRLYYFAFLDSKDEEKQRTINRLQTKIKSHQLLKHKQISRRVREDEILNVEEVLKMLNRSTRPIEKGLLAVAFEGTKRPNEYLTAKVDDVKKVKEGFEIDITPSKATFTNEDKAKLRVYNLKTYFADFWNKHPFKKEPDKPLFYREDKNNVGLPLGSAGATKIIRKLARLCGIKKKVTLYHLRRGGYTWKKTSGMNDDLASEDMGWIPGSEQKRCYLSITDEQLGDERKKLAGVKIKSKTMEEVKDKVCPWCYTINPPGNDVCKNCSKELDIMRILEKEREEKKRQEERFERIEQKILMLAEKSYKKKVKKK